LLWMDYRLCAVKRLDLLQYYLGKSGI